MESGSSSDPSIFLFFFFFSQMFVVFKYFAMDDTKAVEFLTKGSPDNFCGNYPFISLFHS
jgi:hypothetical protein